MKISEFKKIIQEEVRSALKEVELVSTLYKVSFKPEFRRDSDSSNASIQPVFVQMTNSERSKLGQYAAIDKIGGYGSISYDALSASKKLGAEEMNFQDVMKLIKTLHKVKIYR